MNNTRASISTTQHSCFTRLATPIRPHPRASRRTPTNGRQQAAASRIPLHHVKEQRTEDGEQRTEPPYFDLALSRTFTRSQENQRQPSPSLLLSSVFRPPARS